MSEKNATAHTILHLRFKLRVPPDVFHGHSREAASAIASVEGLISKIWISREEELGGMYLFAKREAAEAYLNHPAVQAVRCNPAVVSTESQLWNVDSSLSALTRAPLGITCTQDSEAEVLGAGGRQC
jgi:hypothetical protein